MEELEEEIKLFESKKMTIKEAIKKGIRRVYDPNWLEEKCYLLLPKEINGKISLIAHLFSEETQNMIGCETPQSCLITQFIHGDKSDCYEYFGELSTFDKEEK